MEIIQAQHTEELKEIRAKTTKTDAAIKTAKKLIRTLKSADADKPAKKSKAKFLNATKIGNLLAGISAIRVNQLLLAEGLQYPYRDPAGKQCWRATEKGQQFSKETSYKKDDRTYYRLKWKNSVLDYLQNC